MSKETVSRIPLPEFALWKKYQNNNARNLVSFDLEITARCNNNCRHCYINLPADDNEARKKELPLKAIAAIAEEAKNLGVLWCLLTGGEPLLREDFFDIYLHLKKKGFLVSVFTNATLITKKHAEFFKKYPPRDIEVSVYGVTPAVYDGVTRNSGSFENFRRGLQLLLDNGVKVRFKAMALHSNVNQLPEIAQFCRKRTKDYFRFDPFLHLRFDRDALRNQEIIAERLSPARIVTLEQADPERFGALKENCDRLILSENQRAGCNQLFYCGAGNGDFTVSYNGFFRLCSSLWGPGCVYDLKQGSLSDAWNNFVTQVRAMRSNSKDFLEKCNICPIINLCLWCPAHSYLETGKMDTPIDYFCKLAHARAEA